MQQAQQGNLIRQKIIEEIENLDPEKPRRLLIYIGNIGNPNSQIMPTHTVPLADALSQMGRIENLDLMIHLSLIHISDGIERASVPR